MDQETKEYLDRRLLPLVKRKDIEKLRQETKANFRQWKEETRTHLLDMIKELKTDLKKRGKEEKEAMDTLWSELKETQLPNLWNQGLVLPIKELKEEMRSVFSHSSEEWKTEIDRLAGGSEEIRDQLKQISEEASSLHEKIKEGLTEIKEELGAMLRFSFADLEKKISALEVRIKALEKMVFH